MPQEPMPTLAYPTLSHKRTLHAELKQMHGDAWHPSMKPMYDERGFASVVITRFDPAFISRMSAYPIHFLELHPQPADDANLIRRTVPVLIQCMGQYLEWLDIRNTSSLVDNTEHMRDVLPHDSSCFAQLPSLRVASFTRVNVSDGIVKALCQNPKLYRFDADEAVITKRCVRYFAACSDLRFVLLDRCRHFPKKYEPELKERLPNVEIVRLK